MILSYKDIPIHVVAEGEGEAIILLHGFLENSTMWNDLLPIISKSNRVVAIDLLGHGETGCLGYIHTMEDMAQAVDFVVNHLHIEKATFIGHSMGGYVALAFADLFPEKMMGLCLMNSTALPDSKEKKAHRDRAIKAVKQNHKTFVSMAVANLFAEHNRIRVKEEIDKVRYHALKTPLQGIIAALEGMKIRKDYTAILLGASFKTQMIIGEKDSVLEYDVMVEQAKITGTDSVIFPDGHMSYIENINELTYNLLHFIEK